MSPDLEVKLRTARALLGDWHPVLVAFSGGVDSSLVLKLAVSELGRDNVLAVTGRGPAVAEDELDDALRIAGELGAEHLVIDTHEIDDPNYASNPTNRCYFCKTTLYETLAPLARARNINVIVNGTNADDLGDFRPGLTAASEHKVRSPLAEAGLTKAEVREISASLGLPTHDKPASPCLSSRIQYGDSITVEKLRMIEAAERAIKEMGIRECRVRMHGELARIEIAPSLFSLLVDPSTAARLDARLREIGFRFVTLDMRGFRSGSLNDVVQLGGLSTVIRR